MSVLQIKQGFALRYCPPYDEEDRDIKVFTTKELADEDKSLRHDILEKYMTIVKVFYVEVNEMAFIIGDVNDCKPLVKE